MKKWWTIFCRTFFTGYPGESCPYCGTPTIESAYWAHGENALIVIGGAANFENQNPR